MAAGGGDLSRVPSKNSIPPEIGQAHVLRCGRNQWKAQGTSNHSALTTGAGLGMIMGMALGTILISTGV